VLFVLANALTTYVLGPKWSGSTDIIKILAVASVAAVGGAAIRPMLEGRGHPRSASVLIVVNQALMILTAYVISPWTGIVGVAWGQAVVQFALLSAWVAAAKRVLPDAFRGMGKIMFAAGLTAALAAMTTLAVITATGSAWGALTAAVMGAAMTLIILLALDRALRLGLVADLKKALPSLFPSS
jgi:O-antigen/teichoic acid export membrane protein